jgi:uncharacterized protein YneF (UPF0154 family)
MEDVLGFLIFAGICVFIFRKQIKEYLAKK